jgi:protein-disulfide isomerase
MSSIPGSTRPLSSRIARTRALLLGGVVAASALAGCGGREVSAAAPPASGGVTTSAGLPEVLATIGDEKITMADVRSRIGDDLDQLEARYRSTQHKQVERALDEIVRARVLNEEAKRRGKTVDELIAAEAGGSLEPSDVEISAWYNENPTRTGGRPLEQLRSSIGDFLRGERRKSATAKLEARLNAERKVSVKLEPYRIALNNDGAPSRGPANAAVTLVEFSDFECPYCGRFFPTLKQVEQKYGDRVRVVYRQFPLTSIHQYAFKAAEASLCANDQGKFWEMHDVMFQDQKKLAVSDLKAQAGRLGLDQKKFDTCLETGRFTGRVQDDVKEGTRAGVNGTPALFVNGVAVEGGAVSLETITKAIDAELARGGK